MAFINNFFQNWNPVLVLANLLSKLSHFDHWIDTPLWYILAAKAMQLAILTLHQQPYCQFLRKWKWCEETDGAGGSNLIPSCKKFLCVDALPSSPAVGQHCGSRRGRGGRFSRVLLHSAAQHPDTTKVKIKIKIN